MMEYFRVARIVRPHGVNGMVKVEPLTYDVARFSYLKDAYLEQRSGYTPVTVSGARILDEGVLLHISGVDDRNQAEELRNIYLCVDRAHTAKLPEGVYLVADLIGCKVCDTDGNDYGEMTDVLETGPADVYVVSGRRKLMFPALKKVLANVDIESKSILVHADILQEVGLFED